MSTALNQALFWWSAECHPRYCCSGNLVLQRLAFAAAVLAACCWISPVSAGAIYRCGGPSGNISIQDRPCGSGSKTQRIYRDTEPRSPRRARSESGNGGAAVASAGGSSAASSGNGVPVGLKNERNKGVICGLLQAEKLEAQEQIAGRAKPPPGEDPADNLVKIERQRSRVACE